MGQSGRAALTAINVPDLSPVDDDFLQLQTETPIHWIGLSGMPRNAIERAVRRPRLSRYRAATEAAWAARTPGSIVISHLPSMTAAVVSALRAAGRRNPHLGFSFNFTDLPEGARRDRMIRAFANVTRFAVYSQFERGYYAEQLGIASERLRPVIWTQSVPAVAERGPDPGLGDAYVCAVGGEGRDFAMLIEAARRVRYKMLIIARPDSLAGLSIPDNVQVRANVPARETWLLASRSRGVLTPLKTRNTCCGHITIVSAKLLGIPQATTESSATTEYVQGRRSVLQCQPGEPADFAARIEELIDDHERLRSAAISERESERAFHDRSKWAAFLDEFIRDCAL